MGKSVCCLCDFRGRTFLVVCDHFSCFIEVERLHTTTDTAVKAVKRLLNKCQETRQSEFQALLDWNNTPTEGVGSSLAQQFLGSICQPLLPMTESMLKPAYDDTTGAQALKGKQAKQPYYYDHQACDLPPIAVGETVRL